MKVKIGEYDVECTVEEFEKLRTPAKPLGTKVDQPFQDYLDDRFPPAAPAKPFHAAEAFTQQFLENSRRNPVVPAKPFFAPQLAPLTPNPAVKIIVRGVKSLVIGTVGRYGKQGLTFAQIKSLSGLDQSQVRNGIYSAMDEDQGPPLIRRDGEFYFCTEIGESYALVSDFGKQKIVHKELYMPNGKAAPAK